MNPLRLSEHADGLGGATATATAASARTRREPAPGLPGQRLGLADPVANFNAVGGSTILYAAHFPRFHPSDFRVQTLDGVADDWPIDYATLEPYYAVNARMMGVAGLAGDPAYPPKQAPLPPVPLGRLGETLARGFNRLGWHWWPSDSAITTREYEGRAPCINLGHVPHRLRAGRQGEHRHHVLAGRASGTGAQLADALPGARDHASTRRPRRRRHLLRRRRRRAAPAAARSWSVACNGIGTPRLLLNSRSAHFPDGLANRSGLVGKNLMFHPYGDGRRASSTNPLEGYKGRPAAAS